MAIFNRKDEKIPQKPTVVLSTRSSEEPRGNSWMDNLRGLAKAYENLPVGLPFEIYDYVELLALYNPDYSQAVNNIVTLGNPGFNIVVEEEKNRKAKTFVESIEMKAKTMNQGEGGFPGMVKKMLYQAAVYGAMCGEYVLDSRLTDVKRFAFISPKSIRFFWSDEEGDWHPYQKIDWGTRGMAGGSVFEGTYKKLNKTTFYYQAVFSLNNSPYGVPPFFASLENVAIQRDMIDSLKNIVRKMGLIGIMQMVIERMPMMSDETQIQYENRLQGYLTSYQNILNEMLATGGIAHFDDVQVNNLAISERAFGADAIFKLNEEQIFSGLHSLPSVQGRSYSTTETYANVSYDMILRNAEYFTSAVKYIMESGLGLMAMVWGLSPVKVRFKFKENKTLQRLQNAQAESVEYKTERQMWKDGLLNQEQVAQRRGFQQVAEPKEEPEPDVSKPDEEALPEYTPPPPGGQRGSATPAGGEGEVPEEE